MVVETEHPPGARSCCQSDEDGELLPGAGGTWRLALDHKGRCQVKIQRERLLASLPNDQMRSLFQAEWARRIKRAREGKAVYGKGEECDVMQMVTARDVLELRMGKWLVEDDRRGRAQYMAVRYFFSEPTALPDTLLGLTVYWKVPEEISRREQSKAAKNAQSLLKNAEKDKWEHVT